MMGARWFRGPGLVLGTAWLRGAGLALATAVAAACAPATVSAPPQPVDLSVMPEPGPSPSVDFPEVERFTLSNGLPVWLVERPGLPMVTMQLLLEAGGVGDPSDLPGLASLTAAMLTEGTESRTATQIADEMDFLAINLGAGTGRETAVVNMTTLTSNLDPALDLFADVIANPAFRQEDWQRIQQQRLVSILQSLDQPTAIAGREFSRIVYGDEHPYGRDLVGTPESVQAITPEDLRGYHERYYTPANANLIVVGDVDARQIRDRLEGELSSWRGGTAPPAVSPPSPDPIAAATIYLIDKPGAAQSEIRIGHEGVARSHRDYFALVVMNALLGGEFTSRINLNLREDKGYTYGASSSFTMGRIAGPFLAGAGVQTAVTKESVIEFMRELEEIQGARPASEEEVERTKLALIRREPLRLEANAQIAGRIAELIRYGLPADYFDRYTDEIAAVTAEDVNRVAREHIRPGRFAIVIVGDRAAIEQDLRTLPYPLEIVPIEGQTVPATQVEVPQ